MPYCVAYGCNNRQTKGCGIYFFSFPKNDAIRKQWVHYCKRSDFKESTPFSRLCSKHFSSEMFERNPVTMLSLGYENARPKLKDTAVPDIPLNVESSSADTCSNKRKQSVERGALQKRQRAEVIKTIVEWTPPSAKASDKTDFCYGTDQTEACPKKMVDACFQAGSKPKTNTKRSQVKPATQEYGVQVSPIKPLVRTVGTQCKPEDLPKEQEIPSKQSYTEEEETEDNDAANGGYRDRNDSDYIPSEEEPVNDEDIEHQEMSCDELLKADEPHKERQFLVTESSLLELLNKCKVCGQNACVTIRAFVGTMIVVDVLCIQGHDYTWRSQVCSNAMPWGNILLSAAILFSGSSPAKVVTLFNHLRVPVITTRTFSNLQYAYLVPSVLRTWDLHQADMINDLHGQQLSLGGDARCDSPGHSAKFGSYTLMHLGDNRVLHMELIQSNEVKNSYNMEIEGLKRGMEYLEDCGLTVAELVTDRHVQVKKYMSEQHADKMHYFDVWHVAKGVSKKLEQAAKKKDCGTIRPWIKSTVNHLYWIAATSGKNGDLKKAKWMSLLNHVSDKHEGHGTVFAKCEHGPIDEPRKWIRSGSRPYKALRDVVESPYLLRDLGKLSPINQTYGLEVYHNVVNHFASKSNHYFFASMLARLHLAALHFNENVNNPQAKTKAGVPQFKVQYPKAKKGEEVVVKPRKQGPSYRYVQELMEVVVNRRRSHPNYLVAKDDARKVIGDVPEAVASNFKKFDKQDLIDRHKSRYVKNQI